MSSKRKNPIIIGLDFGTTHSGLAWAPKGGIITPISGWPARLASNNDKEKVRTALAYRGGSDPPYWGYNVPPHETPIKWVKLLLLDEDDLPRTFQNSEHLRQTRLQIQASNRHPVEVVADYLRELWKYAVQAIQNCIGKRLLSASPLVLVVTLPAIWPLYARQRMREAVQLAGILDTQKGIETRLEFISEPEAAALATIEDFADVSAFKKNDRFVVCDAGGGTVDLITYKVLRENPAQVKECVRGEGRLCGAVCLDERFFQLLKAKLPRAIWDSLGKTGLDQIMEDRWENGLKTQFRNDSTAAGLEIQIPYGGTKETRFHSPNVTFTQKELAEVYNPVVAEVVEVIFEQIRQVMKQDKQPPKFVILAGGFGKSFVLRKSLQESLEAEGMDTEILQARGERPWTAVCRGAVLRGFKESGLSVSTVDARVARASYGTTVNIVPWDADDHDSRDRVWCATQREFLAVDQTQWFITIGETLGTNAPVSHFFWQDFDKPQGFVETEIVYCEAKHPPSRCEDSVKRLCLIRWANCPDFDKLPKWTNARGQTFRQVHYEIRMVPDGASLDFEIFYEGTMVASKNVQVDCTDSGAAVQRRWW